MERPTEKRYIPSPADLSGVELPESLNELTELIAENVHEVWAKSRMDRDGNMEKSAMTWEKAIHASSHTTNCRRGKRITTAIPRWIRSNLS